MNKEDEVQVSHKVLDKVIWNSHGQIIITWS